MDSTSAPSPRTDGTRRRILIGVMLLIAGFAGQCAGGHVLDPLNPVPGTLLALVLCVVAAIMAFNGRSRKTVVILALVAFCLTTLVVFGAAAHWLAGGVWVFDVVALLTLAISLIAAGTATDLEYNKPAAAPAPETSAPRLSSSTSAEWPARVRLAVAVAAIVVIAVILVLSMVTK